MTITRETSPLRAYEVMASVMLRGDAEELARRLVVGRGIVRAWCREPESDTELSTGTGKFGPLDRLRTLIAMIREDDGCIDRALPIPQYVSRLCDGVHVPAPRSTTCADGDISTAISKVLTETGEAIEKVNQAWFVNSPGHISPKELAKCRREIEEAMSALASMLHLVEKLGGQDVR